MYFHKFRNRTFLVFAFFSLLTLVPAMTLDACHSLWTGKKDNEQGLRWLSACIPCLRQGMSQCLAASVQLLTLAAMCGRIQ